MKKILLLPIVLFSLSACGAFSIPQCVDELDNCSRGGAYTEERTARGVQRVQIVQTPIMPEIVPMPEPVAQPVVEPVPEAVYEAPSIERRIMRSAEPQFKQITK